MSDNWGNDPIQEHWGDDPIVAAPAATPAEKPLPRWDIPGDIGRAAEGSVAALKEHAAKAFPSIKEDIAQSAKNRADYGAVGGAIKTATVDELGKMGNALKLPLDALGVVLSPVTGALHGTLGSALSYVTPSQKVRGGNPFDPESRRMVPVDPKAEADNLVDTLSMAAVPEGGAARAAAITQAAKTGNTLKTAANLKPGAAEARAAGYVLPPTAALEKPGVVNSLGSGWGGKIKLQQGASVRNQEVTNGLAAEALGLPKDTVLTDQVFRNVRQNASKAYKAVGSALPEITTDQTFHQNIDALGGRNSAAGQQFPGVMKNEELDDFIKNIGSVKKFTPDAGLEVVRKLRKDATSNLKAFGDPNKTALGMSQRKAADEIDDLIERNLTAAGQTDLVKDYRGARQLLAKSHDVEGATNLATGDVSAKGLARLSAKGKPLTGPLKTIADTANAFPKAMQNTAAFGGDEPYSALDAFASAGSFAAGHPEAALTILGRPIVRNALLSKVWQDRMIPNLSQVPVPPPPAGGNALLHNTPLPGVQNQLAKGIFRAAHVNGLRAMTVPQAAQTIPNGE